MFDVPQNHGSCHPAVECILSYTSGRASTRLAFKAKWLDCIALFDVYHLTAFPRCGNRRVIKATGHCNSVPNLSSELIGAADRGTCVAKFDLLTFHFQL